MFASRFYYPLYGCAGNILEQFSSASFGTSTGSSLTRYTYTGRERDPDTGLLYYRARWYDPKQGRFISEDPIGFEGGSNLYAYVENNPINFSDPLGLQKDCCNKSWSECWGRCIEMHRLDNLLPVVISALPKRMLPPFRVVQPSQRLTTVLSSAGNLLRNAVPSLAEDLRGIGRSFSRIGTPWLVFEGFYDLGIIASCAELCHRNPCN